MVIFNWFKEYGWRHLVGLLFVLFAMYPILFVLTNSFADFPNLSNSKLIPDSLTLKHYDRLSENPLVPYYRWLFNTYKVALIASFFNVLLGTFAAFAFSRLHFKGRRVGLITLVIVQMFPAFLAFVAIYLLFFQIGDVIPGIGLGTHAGLMLVYLGGSIGFNAWLIKGFMDTISTSLDEAAKVDGANEFEIFSNNQKLISNAGYYSDKNNKFNKLSRSTSLHCALTIEDYSSCNFSQHQKGLFIDRGLKVLKKNVVFNYAMAPFIIARAWEQHKISSTMNLPMVNLVAGIGYGYANAGPTHYSNEDLGLANLIVGSNIYTVSDPILSSKIAKYLVETNNINFVRIEREPLKNINHRTKLTDLKNGFRILSRGNKVCVISHGYILNKLNSIINSEKKFKDRIFLIDLFRSKPISDKLKKIINNQKRVVSFDEQFEMFNLSNILLKFFNKNSINVTIDEISLKEKIDYGNDGRENILDRNNLSSKKIIKYLNKII